MITDGIKKAVNGFLRSHGSKIARFAEWGLFPLILILWPFAGLHRGVDIADTTYALTNYTWIADMDPMWLLATWLPNLLGSLLTHLPGGAALAGMKAWCTILVPATVLPVYYVLGVLSGTGSARDVSFGGAGRYPAWLRFLSLWIAESLCWCPTVILYNYLTYFFMTIASLFILAAFAPGAEARRARRLVLAGFFLGVNLFVRFPNIVEILLILGVWFFVWVTVRRAGGRPGADETAPGHSAASGWPWKELFGATGWCVLGYIAGVIIPLVIVCICYGPQAYFDMIGDLFSMTAGAEDYTAAGMLGLILEAYATTWKELVPALLAILLSALLFFAAGSRPGLRTVAVLLSGLLFAVLFRLYYGIGVFTRNYQYYDSMFEPAMMLLILILVVGVLTAAGLVTRDPYTRGTAVPVILLILITPLGSNNYTYPVVNNLFVILPFGASFLLLSLRALARVGEGLRFVALKEDGTPVKEEGRLAAFLPRITSALQLPCSVFALILAVLVFVQGSLFHLCFAFGDGMNGERRDAIIRGIPRASGMLTTGSNAAALTELYVRIQAMKTEQESGAPSDACEEAIICGGAPGLHYLLDLRPALFTAWPDLDSNGEDRIRASLTALANDPAAAPLVILRGNAANPGSPWNFGTPGKVSAILDYLSKKGYNELFRVDAAGGVFYVVYGVKDDA